MAGKPAAGRDPMKVRCTRAGVHAFNRETGLNVLFDEVQVPSCDWAEAPRYLSIALTNACDLRCTYCYAPKHAAALDVDDVLAWAGELDAAGCLGVGFGGGEPTLHPQFARLCHELNETTAMAVTFTTHGHRLDDHLIDQLAGAVHFARLSVDGVGATYERLRRRPFDRVRRAAERLASVVPFGINTVVNADTIGELDAVATFAVDVGAVELLLLPEQPAPGTPGLPEEGRESLTRWIRTTRPQIRLAIARSGLEEAVPTAEPIPSEGPLEAHMHIDASGALRPHAYSPAAIKVSTSVLEAIRALREAA